MVCVGSGIVRSMSGAQRAAASTSSREKTCGGSPGIDLGMNTFPEGFAPRLGSYRVTDKTVIRVGYGRGFTWGFWPYSDSM